ETAKKTAREVKKIILKNISIETGHPWYNLVTEIRSLVPENIDEKGITYDLAIRPEEYLYSYMELGKAYQCYGLRPLNVFPLSTSTIPRHVTIDTKILLYCVLGV